MTTVVKIKCYILIESKLFIKVLKINKKSIIIYIYVHFKFTKYFKSIIAPESSEWDVVKYTTENGERNWQFQFHLSILHSGLGALWDVLLQML